VIIVDTNVFSEATRPDPEPLVLAWMARRGGEIGTTSVTVAELRYGIARMPEGARKHKLELLVDTVLAGVSVLPFDEDAAAAYALIRTRQEAAGIVASELDIQIAAIAAIGGHSLATRNVKHFDGTGIAVIDPWVDQ